MKAMASELREWLEQMQIMAADLQPNIVAWGAALSDLLDAPSRRAARERGEPNGYGGVAHTGPFERMLPSQWALLELEPDEFVRRMASHELSYFQLEQRRPAGSAQVIAVVDAGPAQLGQPRIAQLAALVVLARRAERTQAEFCWSIAQQPGTVHRGITAESLSVFLAARSLEPFVAPIWADLPPGAEAWWLGPEPTGAPANVRVLTLREVADADPVELAAQVSEGSLRGREIRLARLADACGVRLLRNPWAGPSRPELPLDRDEIWHFLPRWLGPIASMRRVPGVQKLAVFGEAGLAVWSLAALATKGLRSPKRYLSQRGSVVAVGWGRRSLIHLEYVGAPPKLHGSWAYAAQLFDTARITPGFGDAVPCKRDVVFRDAKHSLWHLSRVGGLTKLASECHALEVAGGEPIAIIQHEGKPCMAWFGPVMRRTGPNDLVADELRFVHDPMGNVASFLVAVRTGSTWRVQVTYASQSQHLAELATPPGFALVEVRDHGFGATAADRFMWLFWRPSSSDFVELPAGRRFSMPRPAQAVVVAPDERWLLLHGEAETLELWDRQTLQPLWLGRPAP